MGNRLLSWKDTLLFPPPSNFFPRARFRGRIITACIFLEIIKWRKVVVAMCAREFFKFFGFCSIFFHSIVITLCNDYYGFERFSEKEWWFYSTINEHLYTEITKMMEWSFSETILLYSRSQIKYYPSTCANINLSRYYIFNFNFFFPFNFSKVEILWKYFERNTWKKEWNY